MQMIFRPAGEQEVEALRQLFKGYSAFQQKRYPIPSKAEGNWVHAITTIRAPTSILQDEQPTSSRTRNVVFNRHEILIDGWEAPAEDDCFHSPVRERFFIWHNAEVWKAYEAVIKLQTVMSESFTKELK